MKYGYFDDKNREYVITEPKTPLPWINYLGCDDFFLSFQIHAAAIVFIRMQGCSG